MVGEHELQMNTLSRPNRCIIPSRSCQLCDMFVIENGFSYALRVSTHSVSKRFAVE